VIQLELPFTGAVGRGSTSSARGETVRSIRPEVVDSPICLMDVPFRQSRAARHQRIAVMGMCMCTRCHSGLVAFTRAGH